MKCKKCKQEMIRCGFGEVGSFVGNARWECRNKDCENNKYI